MESIFMLQKVDEDGKILLPRNIRSSYDIQWGTQLEVIAHSHGILLRKHVPRCTLCESEESLRTLNGTFICADCEQWLEDLKKISESRKQGAQD